MENNNNNNNNNIKTFNLYVDDFQSCKNPIEWMKIKNKDINNSEVLLYIPFSPLIKIKSFEDAIYKQKITLPNSKGECILQSINTLYKNKNIYFSKEFLKEIDKLLNNETTIIIRLNIYYDLNEENFTFSHLFFLNFLTKLGSVHADLKRMTIEISKNNFSTIL